MEADATRWRYRGLLTLLVASALILCARLAYVYLADASHFPISTVKITATFQRITRKQLETVFSKYQNHSYFSLPVYQLQSELQTMDWADKVDVGRVWPDVLTIRLVEKEPVAKWNHSLITADGRLFNAGQSDETAGLADLLGPDHQENEALQIYQKLSKLLSSYGLRIARLRLHENQSWDLSLSNGVKLRLGKQDIEKRLERFCKAYHTTFVTKLEQLASVDLRYERGMAVQWRQQTGR